jgi:hypothetical protein
LLLAEAGDAKGGRYVSVEDAQLYFEPACRCTRLELAFSFIRSAM